MPFLDQTGPRGAGAMTGRGFGLQNTGLNRNTNNGQASLTGVANRFGAGARPTQSPVAPQRPPTNPMGQPAVNRPPAQPMRPAQPAQQPAQLQSSDSQALADMLRTVYGVEI